MSKPKVRSSPPPKRPARSHNKNASKSPSSRTLASLPVELPPVRPTHSIQFGAVRGSIWSAGVGVGKGPFFTLTLARITLKPDETEDISDTFEPKDVRHLARVATDCAKWIEWQQRYHAEQAERR